MLCVCCGHKSIRRFIRQEAFIVGEFRTTNDRDYRGFNASDIWINDKRKVSKRTKHN